MVPIVYWYHKYVYEKKISVTLIRMTTHQLESRKWFYLRIYSKHFIWL